MNLSIVLLALLDVFIELRFQSISIFKCSSLAVLVRSGIRSCPSSWNLSKNNWITVFFLLFSIRFLYLVQMSAYFQFHWITIILFFRNFKNWTYSSLASPLASAWSIGFAEGFGVYCWGFMWASVMATFLSRIPIRWRIFDSTNPENIRWSDSVAAEQASTEKQLISFKVFFLL